MDYDFRLLNLDRTSVEFNAVYLKTKNLIIMTWTRMCGRQHESKIWETWYVKLIKQCAMKNSHGTQSSWLRLMQSTGATVDKYKPAKWYQHVRGSDHGNRPVWIKTQSSSSTGDAKNLESLANYSRSLRFRVSPSPSSPRTSSMAQIEKEMTLQSIISGWKVWRADLRNLQIRDSHYVISISACVGSDRQLDTQIAMPPIKNLKVAISSPQTRQWWTLET